MNASIYIWRRNELLNLKSKYDKKTSLYVMPAERSIDIDSSFDWKLVENILKKNEKFQKIVYGLFFLSVILEGFHLIIPNRSFQLGDLIGNILGVLVAYSVVKIYLLFKP